MVEAVHPPKQVAAKTSQWSVVLPAFVVHGLTPSKTIAEYMPRKMDKNGQSVATPGIGIEYQSEGTFNFITALVKDCYDNYAGTILFGQNWDLSEKFQIGYLAGLYIRETPITCYTVSSLTSSALPNIGGIGLGGSNGRPSNSNAISYSACQFSDNLPIRYTISNNGSYIDIIPSPFIKLSYQIVDTNSFKLNLALLSNFYLNEFALTIPF